MPPSATQHSPTGTRLSSYFILPLCRPHTVPGPSFWTSLQQGRPHLPASLPSLCNLLQAAPLTLLFPVFAACTSHNQTLLLLPTGRTSLTPPCCAPGGSTSSSTSPYPMRAAAARSSRLSCASPPWQRMSMWMPWSGTPTASQGPTSLRSASGPANTPSGGLEQGQYCCSAAHYVGSAVLDLSSAVWIALSAPCCADMLLCCGFLMDGAMWSCWPRMAWCWQCLGVGGLHAASVSATCIHANLLQLVCVLG